MDEFEILDDLVTKYVEANTKYNDLDEGSLFVGSKTYSIKLTETAVLKKIIELHANGRFKREITIKLDYL